MDTVSILRTSITCGRCHTSLIQEFTLNNITKFNCLCNQKVRVLLMCGKCKKPFLNFPYLTRKTNYCSRDCYRNGTDRKQTKICQVCQKEFKIKAYLVERGFGLHCSKKCQFSLFSKQKKAIKCLLCRKEFKVTRSVSYRDPKFCSKVCTDDYKRNYVEQTCRKCNQEFELPRSDINRGRGSFCSFNCYHIFSGETSIEQLVRLELQRLNEPFHQEMKFGRYHADFYLPQRNLIVECDGEYWHRSKKAQERDLRKDNYLQQLGYKIFRLSEISIKTNVKKEISKLLL